MKLPIKSRLCIGIILLPGLVAAQSNDIAPELNLHLVEVDTAAHVEPIYTTGTVLALRTTELVPLVGGMVEDILVGVGDRVEAGQPLLRLRQRDFEIKVERLKHSARFALAEQQNAKLDYENALSLIEKGALSRELLADRRTLYEAASAKLGIAQADLDEARQALEDSTLKAPYTGVITQRNIDEGAYIASFMRSQQPVLQLQEISTMVAVVFVPERFLNSIQVGTKGRVTVAATGKQYETQIHVINDRIDVETRSIDIRLGILNPDYEIKPGQFVEVELRPEARSMVTLPLDTIRGVGAQRHVYVYRNGAAARVDVTVREIENGLVEVLTGLAVGDEVIQGSDLNLVTDGSRLRLDAKS